MVARKDRDRNRDNQSIPLSSTLSEEVPPDVRIRETIISSINPLIPDFFTDDEVISADDFIVRMTGFMVALRDERAYEDKKVLEVVNRMIDFMNNLKEKATYENGNFGEIQQYRKVLVIEGFKILYRIIAGIDSAQILSNISLYAKSDKYVAELLTGELSDIAHTVRKILEERKLDDYKKLLDYLPTEAKPDLKDIFIKYYRSLHNEAKDITENPDRSITTEEQKTVHIKDPELPYNKCLEKHMDTNFAPIIPLGFQIKYNNRVKFNSTGMHADINVSITTSLLEKFAPEGGTDFAFMAKSFALNLLEKQSIVDMNTAYITNRKKNSDYYGGRIGKMTSESKTIKLEAAEILYSLIAGADIKAIKKHLRAEHIKAWQTGNLSKVASKVRSELEKNKPQSLTVGSATCGYADRLAYKQDLNDLLSKLPKKYNPTFAGRLRALFKKNEGSPPQSNPIKKNP